MNYPLNTKSYEIKGGVHSPPFLSAIFKGLQLSDALAGLLYFIMGEFWWRPISTIHNYRKDMTLSAYRVYFL